LQAAAGGAAAAGGKKIRTALLITAHGHLDGKLAAMVKSGDYEVVYGCEPDPAILRRRQSQAHFRDLRWVDADTILGDRSIDLVVVEPLDPAVAVEWGRRVIAAGKHLHLEKPPGNRMAPFRELVEEARRRKLLFQTGYMWRFHEGIGAAIDAARKGWLGEVYMLRGTINTDLTVEARRPLARYRGGMMFELGCHLVDRVVDLWGRPKSVRSWLRHDTSIADGLADNTVAALEYDKSIALIVCSACMPGHTQHRSFELIGTEGVMMVQPVEPGNTLRVNLRTARGPYRAGWQDIAMPDQPRYVGDFRELARALKSGGPLRYSYDFELLAHETMLRAAGEMDAPTEKRQSL
jgi:predicted dehydrogenase